MASWPPTHHLLNTYIAVCGRYMNIPLEPHPDKEPFASKRCSYPSAPLHALQHFSTGVIRMPDPTKAHEHRHTSQHMLSSPLNHVLQTHINIAQRSQNNTANILLKNCLQKMPRDIQPAEAIAFEMACFQTRRGICHVAC